MVNGSPSLFSFTFFIFISLIFSFFFFFNDTATTEIYTLSLHDALPIPLELARETIAAVYEEGFDLNCYVGDELYVSGITPEARRYAGFQELELRPVGDLLVWLHEPPTKLVVVGDSEVLDGLKQR